MFRNIALILIIFVFVQRCSIPEPEDVIPPVVAVVYPHEGAVVSDNVNVLIAASDNDEVDKVWYYLNGVKINETGSSPYTMPLNIANLEKNVNHVIQAGAVDKNDNTGYSAAVNFTVAETPDIIEPVVTIVNPQPGQVVEGTVKILAHAVDERSIQKVAFFINGDSVENGADQSYPYSYDWNTSGLSDSTEHTIFAKAFDGGNNTAVSPVISVTVYPRSRDAGDLEAPGARILYPVDGSIVTGVIAVSVDLADNVGVARAEFYVDGALENEADNPATPWQFNWDTSAKADSAAHTLYVKAYDEAGNIGTTELMTVTVQ